MAPYFIFQICDERKNISSLLDRKMETMGPASAALPSKWKQWVLPQQPCPPSSAANPHLGI